MNFATKSGFEPKIQYEMLISKAQVRVFLCVYHYKTQ